jgi:CheY-like chemotaxis protein
MRDRRFKTIAMTGYGQESDRRRAKEAGFNEHITKPADPQALIRTNCGNTPQTPQG